MCERDISRIERRPNTARVWSLNLHQHRGIAGGLRENYSYERREKAIDGRREKWGVRSDGDGKFHGLWSCRHVERENGAPAERALDRDAAVVSFHDRGD